MEVKNPITCAVDSFADLVDTVNYLYSNDIGVILDETTSPKLSELPMTSFVDAEAKAYSDGSIIGSNELGSFVMYANGLMECVTVVFLCDTPTIQPLPVTFSEIPKYYNGVMQSDSHASIVYAYGVTTTEIKMVARIIADGTSTSKDAIGTARGVWK